MEPRVVCISRTLAAGGELVGQAVAQRLGFDHLDDEIIERAARKAQVSPEVVAAAEHKQSFLRRFIDALAAAQSIGDPSGAASGLPLEFYYQPAPANYATVPEALRLQIRDAIHEVAERGRAVIVAHAASFALAGSPGVLRVLVTASLETRARRVGAGQGLSDKEAAAAIASSDRERRDYFRLFYNVKEELPTHYDLIINTDVITPEQATSLVVSAVQS